MDYTEIKEAARLAAEELCEIAKLKAGQIVVVGCSSSEIEGVHIGKGTDFNASEAVFEGIYPVLKAKGIYLAAQCCEHLNRAIIVERKCAEQYGYDEVNVIPQPKAGGSFGTKAYHTFDEPVAVEHIRAHAGMDVGGTLIGMHLKQVAVPVRLQTKKIGEALLLAARTRPKFIGGVRAMYDQDML